MGPPDLFVLDTLEQLLQLLGNKPVEEELEFENVVLEREGADFFASLDEEVLNLFLGDGCSFGKIGAPEEDNRCG